MRAAPWHLKLGRRTLARVVPAEVPGLYHQVRADGRLSLPANLSWAKNGALGAVLRDHPELEQLPVSAFERLLVPGCTELPPCRCGKEMQLVSLDPVPERSDAHIRVG